MAFELPKLPYPSNALEPHIDATTMEIHHGKHHNAYVTNANNAIEVQPAVANLDVNALIADLGKVPEGISACRPRFGRDGWSFNALFAFVTYALWCLPISAKCRRRSAPPCGTTPADTAI